MSGKWPGGIISKTAPTVTGPTDGEGGSASGIWTLDQAADYEKQGLWPKPLVPRELWGVGQNETYGQLGIDNGNNNVSSPVQVGALTTWKNASAGQQTMLMTKSDGTLWAVGKSNNGQLGQGNTTTYTSPVQVGALTDWSDISAAGNMALGIKTDGTLWGMGYNDNGRLGDGTTTNRSSPVQVGAETTWTKVRTTGANGLAIKTDGTIWAWGYNNEGVLGQGNTTSTSSPVQIGALTDWSSVTGAEGSSAFAIKTDGTMWAWGANTNGALGVGDTTYRSSPTQIGALTTWSIVEGGGKFGAAIKTDATMWAWGLNSMGQLGQGNTTNYSSPVQVGALTTWLRLGSMVDALGTRCFKSP